MIPPPNKHYLLLGCFSKLAENPLNRNAIISADVPFVSDFCTMLSVDAQFLKLTLEASLRFAHASVNLVHPILDICIVDMEAGRAKPSFPSYLADRLLGFAFSEPSAEDLASLDVLRKPAPFLASFKWAPHLTVTVKDAVLFAQSVQKLLLVYHSKRSSVDKVQFKVASEMLRVFRTKNLVSLDECELLALALKEARARA